MSENQNNKISQEMCVHFDTNEHQIPVDLFVTTACSIEKISKELNKKVFNNKLSSQFYIMAPQKGGVIEWLNCVLINHPTEIGVGTFILNFISLRYTNKSLKEWAEKVLKISFDELEKEVKSLNTKKNEVIINSKIAIKLYIYAVFSFLFGDNDDLKKQNILPINFQSSFEAKNSFYERCLQPNNGVKGVGFEVKHKFPIKRNAFAKYIAKISPRDDDVYYRLQRIKVSNPTVDDSQTLWTGKIVPTNKTIKFSMDDEYFKDLLAKGLCPIKETNHIDEMIINFEYRTVQNRNMSKTTKISAKKVYFFNNKEISPIPTGMVIDIPITEENLNQFALFK